MDVSIKNQINLSGIFQWPLYRTPNLLAQKLASGLIEWQRKWAASSSKILAGKQSNRQVPPYQKSVPLLGTNS
jgi:predicted  nucleic acid-binding Zn ribbon protein